MARLDLTPIPSPPRLPAIGHLHQIPRGKLVQHLMAVARDHPEGIFELAFGRQTSIFVHDANLVAELCDETRFRKVPGRALRGVRPIAGDGLFTAFTEEPNWGKAHRILMPAFSQRAMRGYFDLILEVGDQLVANWTCREGEDILVSDEMTRLTLDSIAIAGFGKRFGSFGRDRLDPFLEAMGVALEASMRKLTRLPIQQRFAGREQRALDASIKTMNTLVDRIIAERRAHPDPEARDLLNLMLDAVDPETGESLDDVNIRYQVLTFLIAGHETTSGLLTFAFHLLLRHPYVLAQAYAEVDRVLPGDTRIAYAHIARLDVIGRVLDEALRLWPTAPAFSVGAFEDEVIGGRFRLEKDRPVIVVVPALHRDSNAWDRPDVFDIDRWLPDRTSSHHAHAYKPFGNGARACIGRQFALLEAKLAMALILQQFAISDPHGYRLEIKETLTIKPGDFHMRAHRRSARAAQDPSIAATPEAVAPAASARVEGAGQRLTVLYGTSLGTARDVAEQIAERATQDGFGTALRSLDEALDAPPQHGVIVVVTATYNGRAPDSATAFEHMLDGGGLAEIGWPDLPFAVLGIGNSQWPNYQAFPERVDALLRAAGGERLVARVEADAGGAFDESVDTFIGSLWTALGATRTGGVRGALELAIVEGATTRQAIVAGSALLFDVIANDELVIPAPDGLWDFSVEAPRASTRHIALRLPEGLQYRAGDHLAVHPGNRPERVAAALVRLGREPGDLISLGAGATHLRHLPLGRTIGAELLLTDYVDLQGVASRQTVLALASYTSCPHVRASLGDLGGDAYEAEVFNKRVTLLDLLHRFVAVDLPLARFLELSASIQPRFYSIASSPLASPGTIDLLVGTSAGVDAWSGHGQHQGLASAHLRDAKPGSRLLGTLRTPNPPFASPANTGVPMILISAGTGFAPFRGFLQEREAQARAGSSIPASILFHGCRHPDHDWFYREDMERWRSAGVMELHLAFSAVPEHGCRFVQDSLWNAREQIWAFVDAGALIYLCGDGRLMAPAVRDVLRRIFSHLTDGTDASAAKWLDAMKEAGRYNQDVFNA